MLCVTNAEANLYSLYSSDLPFVSKTKVTCPQNFKIGAIVFLHVNVSGF